MDGLVKLFLNTTKIGEVVNKNLKLKKCFTCKEITYYHYNNFGDRDCGWGCAYRCLQMIISFYKKNCSKQKKEFEIPKILSIQERLFKLNNIKESDCGSHLWIEPHNCACYLRGFCKLKTEEVIYYRFKRNFFGGKVESIIEPSEKKRVGEKNFKIVISDDENANDLAEILINHFKNNLTPVMVDDSIKAYVIGGLRILEDEKNDNEKVYQILLFDPHESRTNLTFEDYKNLQQDTISKIGVYWKDLKKHFLRGTSQKRWMILFPQEE